MMTTRRLSGMPQQSTQQFGIMLETYEAFRKKHQAQNKEIITKNSELHRTNAELLQHRSVIQAQNLSLKGTLLQTEAELLTVKDRLYRTQENERELREHLTRLEKRRGQMEQSDSGLVNQEQLEWARRFEQVMRQTLAAAMFALQAFQSALPNATPSTASPPSPTLSHPDASLSKSQGVSTTSRPVAKSQKISLADRPSSMSVSTRLLVAEPPELSFIVEGGSEIEVEEDEETSSQVPRALTLPLPISIGSTSRSTVNAPSVTPDIPISTGSHPPNRKPTRAVHIAKSLQPRSTPSGSNSVPSSSTRSSPPLPPASTVVPPLPSDPSRAKSSSTTTRTNRRLSGLVRPAVETGRVDEEEAAATFAAAAAAESDPSSTRRSRATSGRRASTIIPDRTRADEPSSGLRQEEEEEEAEAEAEATEEERDDDVEDSDDDDFVLPAPSEPAANSLRGNVGTRRRQSTVVREASRDDWHASSTVVPTTSPEEAISQQQPRRPQRRRGTRGVVYEEGEEEEVEVFVDLEPATDSGRVTDVENARSARRRSNILPPPALNPKSRGPTPEVDDDERDEEGKTVTQPSSGVTSRTSMATGGGSALLQARKESLKKEKDAAKLTASVGQTTVVEDANLNGEKTSLGRTATSEEPEARDEKEENADRGVYPDSNHEEDGGAGGRRARKSVNYALPKLNTKMRRPADYVSVTSSSSSSSGNKPRKSTKSAPRTSSAPTTIASETVVPPLPATVAPCQPTVAARQPSLAGKISKPVPPPLAPVSNPRRSNLVVVDRSPDQDGETDEDEWSETRFLANLKKKERSGTTSSHVGSRRTSHSVVA